MAPADVDSLLQDAEHALDSGDTAREVARAYVRDADRAGCLSDLVGLLRSYDPGAADGIILDHLLDGRNGQDTPADLGGDAPSAPLADLYGTLEGSGLNYDLRPYTARGRCTLFSAPPKRGKSTFATLYSDAKAKGGRFVGQKLDQGRVLYVAPDENWRDVVRRFRSFGTPGERVEVWTKRQHEVAAIARRAREIGADLVVLDTLLRVAGISDENDNAEWDAWFGEARGHVHDSGAVWFALHHDRKGGGKDGEGIRGASAIFGSVDVAISLQGAEEAERRRILQVEGTRLDTADPLVIELDASEARYEAVGEARVVSILEDGALERLRKVLSEEPRTVSSICDRLRSRFSDTEGDVSDSTVRHRLDRLRSAGLATRHGEGGRRDPYQYSLNRSTEAGGATERAQESPGILEDTRSTREQNPGTEAAPESSRSIAQQPKGIERLSVSSEEDGRDPNSCASCGAAVGPSVERCATCRYGGAA